MSTSVGAQPGASNKDSRLSLLRRWTAAVEAHVPGELDEPALEFARLTPKQRGLLVELAAPFAEFVRTQKDLAVRQLTEEETVGIGALVQRIVLKDTPARWLHRAIMFETDVAALAPEMTAEAMRGAQGPGLAEAIRGNDGELGARNLLNWHWSFARDLVAVRDPAAPDDFAASWYHAVALHQLDHMLLAELDPHIVKGFQTFPQDARIQFDYACLADAYGSARVQAVLISNQIANFKPRVPPAESAALQASQRFAKVLQLDSNQLEARVRLARLQVEAGKNADALEHLAAAFKMPMRPQLEYMAHVIAARAEAGLTPAKTDDAVAHLKAAIKLYPTAQTPVVALSHLYLMSGEVEQAAAITASLEPNAGGGERNDPWWSYFQATWLGQGALLDKLRDQVRR